MLWCQSERNASFVSHPHAMTQKKCEVESTRSSSTGIMGGSKSAVAAVAGGDDVS